MPLAQVGFLSDRTPRGRSGTLLNGTLPGALPLASAASRCEHQPESADQQHHAVR
jgi:hypothetical protein